MKKYWLNMSKQNIMTYLRWLASPTLWMSDLYKGGATSQFERGKRVIRLNLIYFTICLIIIVTGVMINSKQEMTELKKVVLIIYPIYCLSRCNEIFMAFVRDVFDKLDVMKRKKNGLEYFQRIKLALRSYIELIFNYALIYYFLDANYAFYGVKEHMFDRRLEGIFDAIYFSAITIVTVGYGDIHPVHNITKLLVVYQVVSGMLLLVVSFTVYVNLTLDK